MGRPAVKFEDRYRVAPDGCWVWQGAKTDKGYGNLRAEGRFWKAHRYSYHIAHGGVPGGAVIMHTCDNPSCVNPDHLIAGSQQENIADREAKRRGAWVSKLTRAEALEIKQSAEGTTELSARFGVSTATIWKIKNDRVACYR